MSALFGKVAKNAWEIREEDLHTLKKLARRCQRYLILTENTYIKADKVEKVENLFGEKTKFLILQKLSDTKEEVVSEIFEECVVAGFGSIFDAKLEISAEEISENLELLNEVNGQWAYSIIKDKHVTLVRDPIGICPLFYRIKDNFLMFGSEKKFLASKSEIHCVSAVNPRSVVEVDLSNLKSKTRSNPVRVDFAEKERKFIEDESEILKNLSILLEDTLRMRGREKVAILFSGGVDSSLLAFLCEKLDIDYRLYTVGLPDSADIRFVEKIQNYFSELPQIFEVSLEDIENAISEVIRLIEEPDVIKVEVALPAYLCLRNVKERIVFSGIGTEELFAGYERHLQPTWQAVHETCVKGMLNIWERDLYRDFVICANFCKELRAPYLDKRFVEYSLKIHPKLKVGDEKKEKKLILRKLAVRFGLPEEIAFRAKKAAQYGSGISKAVKKICKKNGIKYKRELMKAIWKNLGEDLLK